MMWRFGASVFPTNIRGVSIKAPLAATIVGTQILPSNQTEL